MRRAVAAAALGLLVLPGCTRPEMSVQDYVQRTAEICADTERRERALGQPATDADVLPLLQRVRALNKRETERIARLNPPLSWEARHDHAVKVGVRAWRADGKVIAGIRRSPRPLQAYRAQRDEVRRLGAHYGRGMAQYGEIPGCQPRRGRSLLP